MPFTKNVVLKIRFLQPTEFGTNTLLHQNLFINVFHEIRTILRNDLKVDSVLESSVGRKARC